MVVSAPAPAAGALESVLDRIYWSATNPETLLIVAPEIYRPVRSSSELPPNPFRLADDAESDASEPAVALPRGPVHPNVLLPYFGLRLSSLRGLSVAEPEKMAIPQEFAPTGAQMEGLASPTVAAESFLATVSDAQWRALGSASGLGQAQLATAEQLRLFRRLVPATAALSFDAPTDLPADDDGNPLALSPSALASPRLRLEKTLSLSAFAPGDNVRLPLDDDSEFLRRIERTVMLAPEKYLGDGDFDPVVVVPARRKPTQLDPASAALDPAVSLRGAKNVGEVVSRIATATRLTLICDARVAKRRVFVRGGGQVRAGTALAGLCRGLQGAVRRIDDTFLLTEQIPTWLEGAERGRAAQRKVKEKFDAIETEESAADPLSRKSLVSTRAADRAPRGKFPDATDALWSLGETLAPLNPDREIPLDPPGLPLAAQSDVLRQRARERYRQLVEQYKLSEDPPPRAPDRISASVALSLELVYPRLGAKTIVAHLPLDTIHPDLALPSSPPPVAWPKSGVRSWFVPLPKSEDDAEALVKLAERASVTQLRVTVPASTEAEERLKALGERTKESGLGLIAVLRPFEALSESAPLDVDVLGQTSRESQLSVDFAEPERIDVRELARRCQRFRGVVGVTGIALADLSPPGYDDLDEGWNGGGQRSERIRFIREAGLDPADFPRENDAATGEWRERWLTRTRARRKAFLARLNDALTAATIPEPISALGPTGWERLRAGMATAFSDETDDKTPSAAARPALDDISLDGRPWKPASDSVEAFLDETGQMRVWLQKRLDSLGKPPNARDGWAIDVSKRSFAEAFDLLQRAFLDSSQ